MGIVQQLPLVDYFTLSGGYHGITQETHRVQGISPYAVDLYEIPRVAALATHVAENEYTTAAAANTLMVIEVELTAGVWTVHTLTDGAMNAGQCALQMRESLLYPYSPRLFFHSSCAGRNVRISYVGFGSQPLASYFMQMQAEMIAIEQYSDMAGLALSIYHDGLFDGQGIDGKGIYVTASGRWGRGSQGAEGKFDGALVDMSATGGNPVSAFTTAFAWKRVLIGVDVIGTTWSIVLRESAESATRAGLVTPTYDPLIQWALLIDVQNTGVTGVAGEIAAIQQALISRFVQDPMMAYPFELDGAILLGTDLVKILPAGPRYLRSLECVVLTPGTSGSTTIQVYRCSSGNPTGTAMITSPTAIPAGGSPVRVVYTAAQWSTREIGIGEWIRIAPTAVAMGAMNCIGTLYV